MVQYAEVGLKRSTTLTCPMFDKVLMKLGVVDLFLGSALLPPIIQVIVTDNQVFIVTVITEVDIGLTPANFMHISMVD